LSINFTKNKLKDRHLQCELSFLFLANSFTNMYIDGTNSENVDVAKFAEKLWKKSRMFSKQVESIADDCLNVFEEIENEQRKEHLKPQNRFTKLCRFNEADELECHGLLFAACLVLDHKEIAKNLHLPYKEAQEFYNKFEHKQGKMYDNAKLLPSLLRKKLLGY